MRISLQDARRIIKRYSKSNPEYLRQLLYTFFKDFNNIDVYSKIVFSDKIQGIVPNFHKEIYKILEKDGDDYIAAPRGFAKSTIVGLVYLSWLIVYNKEKYILYCSQNFKKSMMFISPIKKEFSDNEMLRFIYGDLTPRATKDNEGVFRRDCIEINNIRVEAVSFDNDMRGFSWNNQRPTLIIFDDIETKSRIINPKLREADDNKIREEIIGALDINGRIKWIGTIITVMCLLQSRIDEFGGVVYDAEDDGKGNLLWPEYWSRDRLDKEITRMGMVAYNQEKRNKPTVGGATVISNEMIEKAKDRSLSLVKSRPVDCNRRIVLGQDFAFGTGKNPDSSAFVSIMERDDGKVQILDYWKDSKVPKPVQLKKMQKLHSLYQYNRVCAEKNSIHAIVSDMGTLNLPLTLITTGGNDSINKKDKTKFTISKRLAIERLETDFEVLCNRIVIPYGDDETRAKMDIFIEELQSWARDKDENFFELGVHPDIPIGLIMGIEYLRNFKKKKGGRGGI